MAEKTKSDLYHLLDCPICNKVVTVTNICPKCCQHFCHACILKWVNDGNKSCPTCRVPLAANELLKCPTLDELRDGIKQIWQPDRCKLHEMHELSLFCYPCEMCVCPSCSCSELHVEHKERIVPLETVFEHYKQTLGQDLEWMSKRRDEVVETLSQVKTNEILLLEIKQHVIQLEKETTSLINSKPRVYTIEKMLNTEKAIAETRSHSKTRKLLPNDCTEFFVPEPSKLIFHFPEFEKSFENTNIQEAVVTSCGFVWCCIVTKKIFPRCLESYCITLKLVQGEASKYGFYLTDFIEEFVHLELNKEFLLGIMEAEDFEYYDVIDDNGNLALAVCVRQTYGDRLKQLEEYNEQLEKEKAKNEASWKSLREWWNEQGPSSA